MNVKVCEAVTRGPGVRVCVAVTTNLVGTLTGCNSVQFVVM